MESSENHLFMDMDSFSDGQTRSKLWLCEKLEKQVAPAKPVKIWIFGSWYGILALYLLVRQRVEIQEICLFDIDSEALAISRKVLDSWLLRGPKISFYNFDCNQMDYENDLQEKFPDIVINTSCEHFDSSKWLNAVPAGTMVIAQSTDMPHPTHINKSDSLEDFKSSLGLKQVLDEDRLYFLYENLSFFRFMVIGIKGSEKEHAPE